MSSWSIPLVWCQCISINQSEQSPTYIFCLACMFKMLSSTTHGCSFEYVSESDVAACLKVINSTRVCFLRWYGWLCGCLADLQICIPCQPIEHNVWHAMVHILSKSLICGSEQLICLASPIGTVMVLACGWWFKHVKYLTRDSEMRNANTLQVQLSAGPTNYRLTAACHSKPLFRAVTTRVVQMS